MDTRDFKGELKGTKSLLAFYDRKEDSFRYHPDLLDYLGSGMDGQLFWDYLANENILSDEECEELRCICRSMDEQNSFFSKYFRPVGRPLHTFIFLCHGDVISIALKDLSPDIAYTERRMIDELTGLLRRKTYCSRVEEIIRDEPERSYALFFFDVVKFKAINDFFGYGAGDSLLRYIGQTLNSFSPPVLAACRVAADRFSFLAELECGRESADVLIQKLLAEFGNYALPYEINYNIGVYLVSNLEDSGDRMLDKAMLAQSQVKGSYTRKIHYYSEELRDNMLTEQEIVGSMNIAMEKGQFVAYYQPQYDHSTGMIVGAEALARWKHPEKGLIPPGVFIPIFEKNDFVTRLDFHVFEEACRFLQRCQEENFALVPISVNFSSKDLYATNFVTRLEDIRQKYGVPSRLLQIELTERLLVENSTAVNAVFADLHEKGYRIELDDFGSGYSSLNVLKDLDVDIIKLDMMFLANQSGTSRGGTILSSVINMAKWLNMPVIAEGVETMEQANFLRSIGCNYVQGYLYSRPLPEQDYEKLLSSTQIGVMNPGMELLEHLNFANFWDPESQETLIFNNFVGGAAILFYDQDSGRTEILRVNQKYLRELGMNLSEWEIIHEHHEQFLTEKDRRIYMETLDRAIQTSEEEECECWCSLQSSCCGDETICLRSAFRVIGSSGRKYLFYKMIRNVTTEKLHQQDLLDAERRFKMASEQVNIYFWEYTIATREMRPCFRCMRDLGLPPLLRNYPDSAIEMGIFPPEVADMYRDWHVQVAKGVRELEAVIPLTMDRVPFRVRYTTEFDENGNPVKAYGSAALVV